MTISQLQRLRRILVSVGLALSGVCGAGLVWAGETPEPPPAIVAAPAVSAAPEVVTPPAAPPPLTKLQVLSNRASGLALRDIGMLGIHYKYGDNTPENGLDCSGLVRYVFKESWGANLPRTAVEISH